MKCLVPVKRVIDYNVKVRVKLDGSGVDTANVKMALNPFDEIALEEAQKLKEKGLLKEVVAVSIGEAVVQEALRTALARGADRAIAIVVDSASEQAATVDPLNIAKILQLIVEKEKPELILMGKQAIDDDCNQTGQMLAGLLGWSQGTFVSSLILDLEKKTALVEREVDGGLEKLLLNLPVVITTDLRLNEPRYITLPNVMKAKSKPIDTIQLRDCQVKLVPHQNVLKVEAPTIRRSGIRVKTARELVEKLKNDAKVI